ncbi:MAG: hypothetical protein LUD84_00430 [Clostridiales bacterium]|nr:hypothetical protein [Clostridiales bacterium]
MQQILQKQEKTVAGMTKSWHNLVWKKMDTPQRKRTKDSAVKKSPKDGQQQRGKSGEKKKFL